MIIIIIIIIKISNVPVPKRNAVGLVYEEAERLSSVTSECVVQEQKIGKLKLRQQKTPSDWAVDYQTVIPTMGTTYKMVVAMNHSLLHTVDGRNPKQPPRMISDV